MLISRGTSLTSRLPTSFLMWGTSVRSGPVAQYGVRGAVLAQELDFPHLPRGETSVECSATALLCTTQYPQVADLSVFALFCFCSCPCHELNLPLPLHRCLSVYTCLQLQSICMICNMFLLVYVNRYTYVSLPSFSIPLSQDHCVCFALQFFPYPVSCRLFS